MKKIKVKLTEKIITLYYNNIIYKLLIILGPFLFLSLFLSIYVMVKYENNLMGLIGIFGSILIVALILLIKNSEKKIALKEFKDSYTEYTLTFNDTNLIVHIGKSDYEYNITQLRLSSLRHFFKIRCLKTKENYIIPKELITKEELKHLLKRG